MYKKLLILVVVSLVLYSCAGRSVTRVRTDEVIDLSGRWNDTDSRKVSEKMIKDSLKTPWIEEFTKKHGNKKPIVIVGSVINRSHEHINVQTFIKDLERSLVNSGRVTFVASKDERKEIRDERRDQTQGFVREDTRKEFGKEIGADFMLKGTINTIVDEISGKRVMYYQIDLELINIEDNTKAWMGQEKIKKVITRGSSTW